MAIRKIYKDTEWDEILQTLVVEEIPDEFIKHARLQTAEGTWNIEASQFLAAVAYIEGTIETDSFEVLEIATLIQSSTHAKVDITMDVDKFKAYVDSEYADLMETLDFE